MLIQIIGVLFAVFALSRVFLRYKDKNISIAEFLLWCFIWVSVIIVAIFPSVFTTISWYFGIGRGVDILLYLGMIAMFYLLFRIYVKVDNQQKEITALVRTLALEKAQKKQKKEQQ